MSEIANIDLETGDLSEFDAVSDDAGDLSAAAAAALHGSYGLQMVVDDTTAIYGRKDVTGTDRMRVRLYVDPNGLSKASTNNYIAMLRIENSSGALAFAIYLFVTASNDYGIKLWALEDDGGWNGCAETTGLSDAVHYVEIDLGAASGSGLSDGFGKLWVDGTFIGQDTVLTNYTRANTMDEINVGAMDIQDLSGTFYIDDIVANDDGAEIGPVVAGVVIFRRRRGA